MNPREEMLQIVRRELSQPASPEAHAVAARVLEIYGSAVRGILFYGSCLRGGYDGGVLDLYVFVDSYRNAYSNLGLVLLNQLLPPNVFYAEAHVGETVVRSKYAVVALSDLGRLTSTRCIEPYFWARFAQPCALVCATDEAAREQVADALVEAIVTFVQRGAPLVAPSFTSRNLWMTTWRETYRCELRPERPNVVDAMWANSSQRYEQMTELALFVAGLSPKPMIDGDTRSFEVPIGAASRRSAKVRWRLRRYHSKLRFLLRLLRNALIFEGGVDYVLWKIERHSGVHTDNSWRSKRFPLLALGAETWRLYKAGAFR